MKPLLLCLALTLLTVFYSLNLWAQGPMIRSQKCVAINATSEETFYLSQIIPKVHTKATNGNTIVGGTARLNALGYLNAYVSELDSANNPVWAQYFFQQPQRYGGFLYYDEFLKSLLPGVDSGYIMIGGTKGISEVRVTRLGRQGDTIWRKTYGGSGNDAGSYITRVGDNGYIFIGTSSSMDGTLSSARNLADSTTLGRVWICRLDNEGNALWSKCFGYQSGTVDMGVVIKPTADGGFICGASMQSRGYYGNFNHGQYDIWLAKLNSAGSAVWSSYYGGSGNEYLGDIEETPDGYVFVGSTNSTNYDVKGMHAGSPYPDAWIVKLDKQGQIKWQRCVGGTKWEEFMDVALTQDNGFVAIGTTYSKDGDIVTAKDSFNVLLTKVSSEGLLTWNKVYGGSDADLGRTVLQTGENEYLITGITYSIDGDIVGNVVGSDPAARGKHWVAQLGSGNTVKGTVYIDANSNGVKDPTEKWAGNVKVTAVKDGKQYATNTYKGSFIMDVDTGSYVLSVVPNSYYTAAPSSQTLTYTSYFNRDSISVALQPIPNKTDYSVSIAGFNTPRPGFQSEYLIAYQNKGTTMVPQAQVQLNVDKKLQFVSAIPAASSGIDTLKWDISTLQPGDTGFIRLTFKVKTPPAVNINDTLTLLATIQPVAGDETPSDDSASLRQIVRGSYDPNDKTEGHGGVIARSKVMKGAYLDYTIRFQNTGTDTAFNVVVRDTLDSGVDWTTLEMVGASHPYHMQVQDGNKIAWTFSNILLPDSNVNEPASHGYLWYRVKAKTTLVPGDVVHNDASIYFDYNLPVVTNDALTLVQDISTPLPITLLDFTGHLVDRRAQLRWTTAGAFNFDRFEVERSLDARTFTKMGVRPLSPSNTYSFEDDLAGVTAQTVFYRLRMVDIDNRYTYSRVLPLRLGEQGGALVVYPNPAGGDAFLSYSAVADGKATLRITDMTGRVLVQQTIAVQKGSNVISINAFTNLLPGQYVIQVVQDSQSLQSRLVVQ